MLEIKRWTTKESALHELRVQQEGWELTHNNLRLIISNQEIIANHIRARIAHSEQWKTPDRIGSGKASEKFEV